MVFSMPRKRFQALLGMLHVTGPEIRNANKHNNCVARKHNLMMTVWQDTKAVCFLSNLHNPT